MPLSQSLNAFPPGLLSLLGIKSGGSNPETITEILQTTLELRDWYLAQQWQEVALDVPNVNAPGFFNWNDFGNKATWVRFVSARSTAVLAAGTTIRGRLGLQQIGSIQWRSLGSLASATAGESLVSVYEAPFIVPPGFRLGFAAEAVTLGTAPSMRLTCDAIQLSI